MAQATTWPFLDKATRADRCPSDNPNVHIGRGEEQGEAKFFLLPICYWFIPLGEELRLFWAEGQIVVSGHREEKQYLLM